MKRSQALITIPNLGIDMEAIIEPPDVLSSKET